MFSKSHIVHFNIFHNSHRDWKTGKTWKMGRHFPVKKKSENFVKTGKVRELYSKYWKSKKQHTGKLKKKYWKSQGNLSASNSENPANMVPYFK